MAKVPVWRGTPKKPLWIERNGIMVPAWAEDPCDEDCREGFATCEEACDNPPATVVAAIYFVSDDTLFSASDPLPLVEPDGECVHIWGNFPTGVWARSSYSEVLGETALAVFTAACELSDIFSDPDGSLCDAPFNAELPDTGGPGGNCTVGIFYAKIEP